MKISELQNKDVVNVADGSKLGRINDMELDLTTGKVKTIIVPTETKLFGLFSGGKDCVISWEQIVKIGSDVILVTLDQNHLEQKEIMDMYNKPRGTLKKVNI